MKWAIKNGKRIEAKPKEEAKCHICNKKVIAKCGDIKVWHWAHKVGEDCDLFGEGETEWHLNWKKEYPIEQQEVIIGNHRADIKTERIIIELQNSPLSSEKIKEREEYYDNIIWLLNGNTLGKNICEIRDKGTHITFKWKWFPSSWWSAKKGIFIDFGDFILEVRKLYNNNIEEEYIYKPLSVRGWGFILSKEEFIRRTK